MEHEALAPGDERPLDGDHEHEGEVGEDAEAAQRGQQARRHTLLLLAGIWNSAADD